MKSNIEVAGLGTLSYEKVYFEVERPVLFLCKFSQQPKKTWIGVLVDEVPDTAVWSAGEGEILDYYLANVTPKMIEDLESGRTTLKDLFDNEVLWVSHRYKRSIDKHATLCQKRNSINPMYRIADNATLSV